MSSVLFILSIFFSYYINFIGSAEERLAVEGAVKHGTKPDTYSPEGPDNGDVQFEIDTVDKIFVGSDFDVKIKLINKSAEQRNVNMSVIIQVSYYTGKH